MGLHYNFKAAQGPNATCKMASHFPPSASLGVSTLDHPRRPLYPPPQDLARWRASARRQRAHHVRPPTTSRASSCCVRSHRPAPSTRAPPHAAREGQGVGREVTARRPVPHTAGELMPLEYRGARHRLDLVQLAQDAPPPLPAPATVADAAMKRRRRWSRCSSVLASPCNGCRVGEDIAPCRSHLLPTLKKK